MKTRDITFVIVTVIFVSCLTIAGGGRQSDLYEQYHTLSRVVATISNHYVEEVDSKELFYGAYKGMLQALDPHSAFLPPEEKEDLETETKGEFGGLGIEITLDKHGILTVVSPIEDTPAFRAGVLAGDRIIKIEGQSTKGISVWEAVKKLRGPKGEPVTITVLHENGKIEDITIVRDIIKLQSAKDTRLVDEKHKVGYVRLTAFRKRTAEDLDQAVQKLLDQGMRALVIDVRFNPGGLLETAVAVADRFLPEGVIVTTKGRRSRKRVFNATKDGTYPDFPVALLISPRSASASEILAGAIQDHKRGVLVGMRTYGKGSVQSVIKLEDGKSAIRLTTAHYYTPSGRLIHHNQNDPDQKEWGVDPDIEVKTTLQDEVDLFRHWRKRHQEEVRRKNGPKEEKKEEAPPAKEPEESEPDESWPPRDNEDGTDDDTKKPKEFHDKPLEAAVNALKGMLLVQERAAAKKTAK